MEVCTRSLVMRTIHGHMNLLQTTVGKRKTRRCSSLQESSKIPMIISICFCVPMLIAAFFLRDHKLENTQSIDNVEEIEKDDDFVDYMKENSIKKIFKRSNNEVA